MAFVYLWASIVSAVKVEALSALLCLGILLALTAYVKNFILYLLFGVFSLTPLVAPVLTLFKPKKRICPVGKAVFISGCDSGFGYMLAQRLDNAGFQVFAGCLFPKEGGATNLSNSGSSRLHVIPLDVTSDISVEKAVAYVKQNLNDNEFWAVVNNAGITLIGEIHWISMETVQKIIQVNTLGVVRVTKAFLPILQESKGRVLTITSQAGKSPLPGIVPYCMSKAATILFSEGLRVELHKWDIQVITVEPFFYRTTMIQGDEMSNRATKEWEGVPEDKKALYCASYIESFIKKMLYFFRFSSGDPIEVVCLVEDVLTDLFPSNTYAPGSHILRLLGILEKRVPKPIRDISTLFTVFGRDLM